MGCFGVIFMTAPSPPSDLHHLHNRSPLGKEDNAEETPKGILEDAPKHSQTSEQITSLSGLT